MNNIIMFEKPATHFEEAFPIGNGRMGSMIYGKTDRERISLNEDTIWSGYPNKNIVPDNAREAYKNAQQAIIEGKTDEAEKIMEQEFHSMWSQVYLPLGTVYMDFGHNNFKNYKRLLSLDTGIAYISYENDGVNYKREYLVSRDYECISANFTADKKGSISFGLSAESELKILNKSCNENTMTINGICPSNGCLYSNTVPEPYVYFSEPEKQGVSFTQIIKVDIVGGEIKSENGVIKVWGADSAFITICVSTSFNGVDKLPGTEGKEHLNHCTNTVSKCIEYSKIKDKHINDFKSLYDRVEFKLTNEICNIPTPKRLELFDGTDLGLYELLFNFGRYLMISSSRPKTRATNLQGIWNEHYMPPWSSNYTVNINTEMNYWPAFSCNLYECFEPFLNFVKEVKQTGMQTAKDYYNAKGFVCHHNVDLWAHTNPVGIKTDGSSVYASWNMSSGWMACQLFELYEYTMDKELLKNEIYPIMKEAALFYLDIMIEHNGLLIVCPSSSPENRYKFNDTKAALSKSATMSQSIVRELFGKVILSSDILGIDKGFANELKEAYEKIAPPQIGCDGRLNEWHDEEEETEIHHRHVSHLYSLYPGTDITVDKTPDLAEACKKSLIIRGDDGTGWSLSWKMNLWAALRDGNHALNLINNQLRLVNPDVETNYSGGGGSYPNMLDAHPPFQIDGNFGSSAAIANMLVQCTDKFIYILPALPDKWEKGSFSGIKVKGNITVSAKWNNKKVIKASFTCPFNCDVNAIINGKEYNFKLYSDKEFSLKDIHF